MSVAPGSGVGSFKVLYIALIYMSLEINLAYTLPRHPPPTPPPLWTLPPSPSGLGLHLSFLLALRGHWRVGAPQGSSHSCRGAGEPALGFVTWRGGSSGGSGGLGGPAAARQGGHGWGALPGHRVLAQSSPGRVARGPRQLAWGWAGRGHGGALT